MYMKYKSWLFTVVFISLMILSGCNTDEEALIELEDELLEYEEELKQLKDEVKEKTEDLTSSESDLDELLKTLDEVLNVGTVESSDGEQVDRLDLLLNPNQEGFYNGEYYSGETGMSGPGEYHTVKDAEEMGYDVILIDYNEFGEMVVDVPPTDAVEGHIEGSTWEYEDGTMEYEYTLVLDLFEGTGIAVFVANDGEVVEAEVLIYNQNLILNKYIGSLKRL